MPTDVSELRKKIKDVDAQIRETAQSQARLEGQRDQAMARLKSEFGVETLEAGASKLEELDAEIARLSTELDEKAAKVLEVTKVDASSP